MLNVQSVEVHKYLLTKKVLDLGKAVAGGLILGPIGLLGGTIGSGRIVVTCLKCGHKWKV